MQLQRNNKPKNQINENVQNFHGYNENTMQAVVQSSVGVAVQQIHSEFKDKLDNKPIEMLADDMIKHHIIHAKEKDAFILELQDICKRQQQEGTNGTVKISGENLTLSLKDIIFLLIRAMREQNHFTQTSYKQRLEQFKFCMESMRDGKACNTGRRNQFCASILHLDYKSPNAKDKIYIISALAGDMRDMSLQYYAEQLDVLQKTKPEQAFKLMKLWVDLSNNRLKKNKIDKEEILQFINSYKKSLEECLYQRLALLGIQPQTAYTKELPTVADAINFLLNNLDELECPTLGSAQMMHDFTTSMATIHSYKKKQITNEATTEEITAIQEFDRLKTYTEFQQSQPILRKKLLGFQETANRYKNKFAFGEKWGSAINLAQHLYKQTDILLQQKMIPYNDFINIEKIHNQFQQALLVAASDKSELRELMDNSIVYHSVDSLFLTEKDKNRLLERIKELKQDIILSDDELERLLKNNTENDGECHLQLFDINRILWQALLTNPNELSGYFYGTLKHVWDLLQNSSAINVQNIKNNLPPSLVTQMTFLLQIGEWYAHKQQIENTMENIRKNLTLPYPETLKKELDLAITGYEIKENKKKQITLPNTPLFIPVAFTLDLEAMNAAIYTSHSADAMCRVLTYIHPQQRLLALRRITFLLQERKMSMPFATVLETLELFDQTERIAALHELKIWLNPFKYSSVKEKVDRLAQLKKIFQLFHAEQLTLFIKELVDLFNPLFAVYEIIENHAEFTPTFRLAVLQAMLDKKEFYNYQTNYDSKNFTALLYLKDYLRLSGDQQLNTLKLLLLLLQKEIIKEQHVFFSVLHHIDQQFIADAIGLLQTCLQAEKNWTKTIFKLATHKIQTILLHLKNTIMRVEGLTSDEDYYKFMYEIITEQFHNKKLDADSCIQLLNKISPELSIKYLEVFSQSRELKVLFDKSIEIKRMSPSYHILLPYYGSTDRLSFASLLSILESFPQNERVNALKALKQWLPGFDSYQDLLFDIAELKLLAALFTKDQHQAFIDEILELMPTHFVTLQLTNAREFSETFRLSILKALEKKQRLSEIKNFDASVHDYVSYFSGDKLISFLTLFQEKITLFIKKSPGNFFYIVQNVKEEDMSRVMSLLAPHIEKSKVWIKPIFNLSTSETLRMFKHIKDTVKKIENFETDEECKNFMYKIIWNEFSTRSHDHRLDNYIDPLNTVDETLCIKFLDDLLKDKNSVNKYFTYKPKNENGYLYRQISKFENMVNFIEACPEEQQVQAITKLSQFIHSAQELAVMLQALGSELIVNQDQDNKRAVRFTPNIYKQKLAFVNACSHFIKTPKDVSLILKNIASEKRIIALRAMQPWLAKTFNLTSLYKHLKTAHYGYSKLSLSNALGITTITEQEIIGSLTLQGLPGNKFNDLSQGMQQLVTTNKDIAIELMPNIFKTLNLAFPREEFNAGDFCKTIKKFSQNNNPSLLTSLQTGVLAHHILESKNVSSIIAIYNTLSGQNNDPVQHKTSLSDFFKSHKINGQHCSYAISLLLKTCKFSLLKNLLDQSQHIDENTVNLIIDIFKQKRVHYFGSKTVSSEKTASFKRGDYLYNLLESNDNYLVVSEIDKDKKSIVSELSKFIETNLTELYLKNYNNHNDLPKLTMHF